METTGLNPVILSTSGFSEYPINCLAYALNVSRYLRCPSAWIVLNANDDFPLPLFPVKTISLFLGNDTLMFFRLWTLAPMISNISILLFVGIFSL